MLKTIETKLGLPASIINDLAHIVEKGVRRVDISSFIVKYIDKLLPADLRDPVLCLINGNPQKIMQWICVLIKADNNQIFTVMAEYILDKSRGKEEKVQKELILLIVKYGTKNLAGSENISKLLKCIADGNQLEDLSSLFTCPSIQAVALRLLKIFKVSDEVSDVIIGVFSGKNALEKGRPAIKLFASKLGFPYPDKLVTSIESMSKEGNPKKFLHWLIEVTGLDKIIDAKIVQGIVCSGTFGLAELSMIIKSICKKIGVAGDLLENLDMIIKGQFTNISIIILMARLVISFVKKNKQTSVEGSDWPVTMKQIDRIESILSSFNADDTWMKISKIISILCVCLNIDSVTTQAIEDLILEGDATYFIKKLSLSSGISFELLKNLLANFDISWSIKDWIIYLVQIICAQFSVPPPLASDIVALTKGELPKNNLQSIAGKIAIHATDQEVRESVRAMCSVLDVNVDIISDLIVILLRQNISDEITLVKCKVILTKSCGFSECFINALVDVAVTRDICALEFFIAEATGVYPEFVHLFTQSLAQKSVSEESYASAISCLITKLEIKNIDVSTVRKALSCNLSSSEIGKLLLKIVTQIFLKVPAFASGFQCLPNSLQTRLEMGHVTNCGEIIDDLLGFIAEEAGVSPDLLKGIKQFALDRETGLLSTWAHTKWHIDPHTTSRLLNSLQKSGLKTSALDVAKNLNFSAKSISHLECFLKGKDPKCHLSEVIWDFLKDIPNVLVSSDIIKQYCISLFEPIGLQPELKESITELVVYQKYDKLMSWAINKVGFDKNIVSELLQTISKFDDDNYVNLFITLLQKIGTFYGLSDDLMENIKLLFHHMAGIGNGQDPSEIVRTILPLFLKEILKQIPELERVGMILLDLIEKPKINCLLSITLVCLEVVCKNEELLNVITSFVRWNDDSLVFKWLSEVFGLEERLCKGLLQLKGEDSVQIVAKRLLMLLATKWKLTDEITVILISVVDRNCLHLVSGSNVEMQEDDIKQYLKNILHQNAVPEEEAEVLVKYLLEVKSDEQLNIQYEHVRVVLRLLGLQSDIVDAFVLFLLEKNHG